MGLDQYIFATKSEKNLSPTDTRLPLRSNRKRFFYWRKHPDLHEFMKILYQKKGGQDEHFNGNMVELEMEDIVVLAETMNEGEMPHMEGRFFGYSNNSNKFNEIETRIFIIKAYTALCNGKRLYYYGDW